MYDSTMGVIPDEKRASSSFDIEVKGKYFYPRTRRQLDGDKEFAVDYHFKASLYVGEPAPENMVVLDNVLYKNTTMPMCWI